MRWLTEQKLWPWKPDNMTSMPGIPRSHIRCLMHWPASIILTLLTLRDVRQGRNNCQGSRTSCHGVNSTAKQQETLPQTKSKARTDFPSCIWHSHTVHVHNCTHKHTQAHTLTHAHKHAHSWKRERAIQLLESLVQPAIHISWSITVLYDNTLSLSGGGVVQP